MTDAHDDEPEGIWTRSTAPQSGYTGRQVGIGFLVLAVGLVLTFGIALALA